MKQEEKNAEIKSDKLNQDMDIQSGQAELGAAVDPAEIPAVVNTVAKDDGCVYANCYGAT